MAFNDLLLQLGGVGRFQKIQVTLVILPLILLASHNTLQNFTAAIPTHHCRPPADTNLSEDGDLEAWLPRDGQGRPESCLLFTSPQRGPPFPNGTETNGTGATEPCPHGWIYDNSTFPSTIVTEVRSPGPLASSPNPCVPILPSPHIPTHTHRLCKPDLNLSKDPGAMKRSAQNAGQKTGVGIEVFLVEKVMERLAESCSLPLQPPPERERYCCWSSIVYFGFPESRKVWEWYREVEKGGKQRVEGKENIPEQGILGSES